MKTLKFLSFCCLLSLNSLFGESSICLRTPSPATFVSGYTNGLHMDDMNSDGIIDIVTANSQSNNGAVLMGNSTTVFGAMTTHTLPASPMDSKPADFNGDGKLDLATTFFSSSLVTVRMGNGSGSFTSAIT